MVSLIQILSWFKDGLFVNEEQFKKAWSSFWHKSERLPLTQIMGLNDFLNRKADNVLVQSIVNKLSSFATKEDLASVMDGLNPMGSAFNMADLNTKPKRNKDSYFVLDQLDENGNPYIFKYDEGIADWVNTKQVVYKDVAKTGGSNKTIQQIDNEKASNKIAYNPFKYFLNFNLGGINSDTGGLVVNKIRIRTKFNRNLSIGERIEFENNTSFLNVYGIYLYLGSQFIRVTGSSNEAILCDGTFDTVWYVLKKADDSEFSEADILLANKQVQLYTYTSVDTYSKDIKPIANKLIEVNEILTTPLLLRVSENISTANSSVASVGFYLSNKEQERLRNKSIGYIELEFDRTGFFSIWKAANVGKTTFTTKKMETISVQKTGWQKLKLSSPLILSANEWLGVFSDTDTASFRYNSDNYNKNQNFWYKNSSGVWVESSSSLNINIYEAEDIKNKIVEFTLGGVNADTGAYVENDIRARSERLFISPMQILDISLDSSFFSLIFNYAIYFKGFKRVRSSSQIPTQIINDGTFDNVVFTFKKADDSVISKEDLTILKERVQVYYKTPKYSSLSAVDRLSVLEQEKKSYQGKYISILSDSIGSFEGWLPAGYPAYYPHGSVVDVQQTYWWKLLDFFGLNLLTLNSYSGSRIASGGNGSASDLNRSKLLHIGDKEPDIILITMGINDYNQGVSLGTYNGIGDIPTTTNTFREAYGKMLNDVLTNYSTSEVWCCTLQGQERNGNIGFPERRIDSVELTEFNNAIKEIASAFGVRVIPIHECGINTFNIQNYCCDANEKYEGSGLHPNEFGFNLWFDVIKKNWK